MIQALSTRLAICIPLFIVLHQFHWKYFWHEMHFRGNEDYEPEYVIYSVLDDIGRVFISHNISFWIAPGSFFHLQDNRIPTQKPQKEQEVGGSLELVASFRETLTLGVLESDLVDILNTFPALFDMGFDHWETYFGTKIYPQEGMYDDRFRFKFPVIDLMYFKRERHTSSGKDLIVNYCCDCDKIVASTCTKRTCGCLICAYEYSEVFPLREANIRDDERPIKVFLPRKASLVLTNYLGEKLTTFYGP